MTMLANGIRFGPYEITGVIGAGGMGEVYRARDTALGRDAALKVLPEFFAADPDRRARFEREAKTLASLNHPHIAQIYGLEHAPGDAGRRVHALVMELVEGEDLAQRIAAGPLPVEDALAIARQIAAALEAAHDQGIVHRDLKPANVRVRADGVVKVLDFGLAKAASHVGSSPGGATPVATPTFTSPLQTQPGGIVGTPAYMAPEQARGRPADRRADIWAFGCVLFEMLTASRPFDGDNVSDLIAAVLKEPAPLERLPADVPAEVRTLIARCLEKDPNERLRDIGEARILLSRPLAAGVVTMTPSGRRSDVVLRAFIGITAVLAVALAVTGWLAWRGAAPAAAPITTFDLVPPEGSELKVAFSPSVAVSPDGSLVAFVARTEGQAHLYVRRRASVTARQLTGTEGASQPAFSPDGLWLAFISGTSLKKIPLEGPAVPLATVNTDARGLTWLDQTSLVYAPGGRTGLMRVSADGGEPASLTIPDAGKGQRAHRWPSPVAGGEVVLYTVGQANRPDNAASSNIEAVTVATGERRVVLERATMARYVHTGHLLFMRGGTLHAVRFDAKRLVASGDAVAVVPEIMEAGTGAAHLSIGEDGTLAYILGTSLRAPRRIAWLDGDGTAQPIELPAAQYGDLRVSPDGTRLAFTQHRNGVWIYDLRRKSLTRLTGERADVTPVWSADGKSIYYVGRTAAVTTILRKPADGSRDAEPLASIGGAAFLGEVIDGGMVAILNVSRRSDDTDPHADIASLPLAPGQIGSATPVGLEATLAAEHAVDVSPDERWMAYQSNENGTRPEVYVREMRGARARWQISIAGGEEPYWAPDGRKLYYRIDDAVYVVAIDTREGFTAGPPQFLYRGLYNTGNDGPSYTVDPKTGRLLMLRPAAGYQQRHTIRVVLNWFEELAAKVPPAR